MGPTAIPTSAAASAGASLKPSPDHRNAPTTGAILLHAARFVLRFHAREHLLDAERPALARAVCSRSPRDHGDLCADCAQRRDHAASRCPELDC